MTIEGEFPDRPLPNRDAPQGTMFPGLDGSPGDARDQPQELQFPLPPLTPDTTPDQPSAQVRSSSISSVPDAARGGQEAPPQEAAFEGEAPRGRAKRSLQERIDSITRARRTAEGERDSLKAQVDRLVGLIADQNHKITALSGGKPAAPAPDPLGLGDAAKPSGTHSFTLDDVKSVVEGTIKSHVERVRETDSAAASLRQDQEASFAEAVQEFPELADSRTRARQLFNRIYDASELRALPNGPYQVALQVRGLLASEPASGSPAAVAERKRQASVVVPAPQSTDIPGADRAADKREYEALLARNRAGTLTDFRDYKRMRVLGSSLKSR